MTSEKRRRVLEITAELRRLLEQDLAGQDGQSKGFDLAHASLEAALAIEHMNHLGRDGAYSGSEERYIVRRLAHAIFSAAAYFDLEFAEALAIGGAGEFLETKDPTSGPPAHKHDA